MFPSLLKQLTESARTKCTSAEATVTGVICENVSRAVLRTLQLNSSAPCGGSLLTYLADKRPTETAHIPFGLRVLRLQTTGLQCKIFWQVNKQGMSTWTGNSQRSCRSPSRCNVT